MIIDYWIFAQAEIEQIDKFLELLGEDHRSLVGFLGSTLMLISFSLGILKTSIAPLLANISLSRSKIIEQRLSAQANQKKLLESESKVQQLELNQADLRTQISQNKERISELLSVISNRTDDFHQIAETLKRIEIELTTTQPNISRVVGLLEACIAMSQNSAKPPNSVRRFDESEKI